MSGLNLPSNRRATVHHLQSKHHRDCPQQAGPQKTSQRLCSLGPFPCPMIHNTHHIQGLWNKETWSPAIHPSPWSILPLEKQRLAEQSPQQLGAGFCHHCPLLLCLADTPKAVCSHWRGWEGVHMETTLNHKCCSLFSSFRAEAGTPVA